MTDPETPHPKVSNRISPIAIVVVVALVAAVLFEVFRTAGHHVTPTGVKAPMAAPANTVMPQQSTVSNTPAPTANTNDASEAQPTGNEVGVTNTSGR